MSSMRTGADYRESLRDGRRVWVMGEGLVDDVTTHPATRAMVEEYVAWYDRHFDPAWQDVVLTPPDAAGRRSPWAYVRAEESRRPARDGPVLLRHDVPQRRQHHPHPGLRHTSSPWASSTRSSSATSRPSRSRNAAAYRELIARTGRFLTFCAGARHHRLSPARGSGRARGAARRPRDRRRPRAPRQGRHAHQPGLRRGRLHRRALRRGLSAAIAPPSSCRSTPPASPWSAARSSARHANPFIAPAQQPLRRARRPDVARRRARPVGARLPDRARRPSRWRRWLLLASALLLAVQGRVHPGPGAGLHACHGARGA